MKIEILNLIKDVHWETPVFDRWLAGFAAGYVAVSEIAGIDGAINLVVGLCTILVMVPRAVMGFLDMRDRIRGRRSPERREDGE